MIEAQLRKKRREMLSEILENYVIAQEECLPLAVIPAWLDRCFVGIEVA